MRISQAAIRGDRPTTRFAAPVCRPRDRQFGLRRTTPARLAQAPTDTLVATPMVAIRRAARGHLGLGGNGGRAVRPSTAASLRMTRRNRAITWSQAPDSAPNRTRPRSATPWRG